MFKKIAMGAAIAAALSSGSAFANGVVSQEHPAMGKGLLEKSYVSISAGSMDFGYSEDPGVVSGTIGVDLDCFVSNLGTELELTGTVSEGEVLTSDLEYMGVGAYATYSYDVGQYIGLNNLDTFARAGIVYGEMEIGSVSDSGTDIGYGAGFIYDPKEFTGIEGIALRVEYTDRDYADSISAGVTYSF